ncbi:MAG TPA: hypothetical protein VM345_20015 [Acidimicrobiales bacterium]|jgi:hypothetical protein|nr:hypothetical protein [Acidimicrobiales bacterium]
MTDVQIPDVDTSVVAEPEVVDSTRGRPRWRHPLVFVACAMALVAALVTTGLVLTGSGDDQLVLLPLDADDASPTTEPSDATSSDVDDMTHSTLAPAPTVVVAPPPTAAPPAPTTVIDRHAGTKYEVSKDPRGRWTLAYYDGSRCFELTVDTRVFPGLLCRVPEASPSEIIGHAVVVDSPQGRVLVAAADPRVTDFSSYPRAGGGIYHEGVAGAPASGIHVVAGSIASGWSDVLVRGGPHHLARVVIPPENKAYAIRDLERITGSPYGAWPAYRKVTSTGYYFGGDQELGFYTDEHGYTCGLYRRLGGPVEGILGHGCVLENGDTLQMSTLTPIPGAYTQDAFMVYAVTNVSGAGLRLELPDRTTVPSNGPGAYADPRGSGWIAFAHSISHVTIPAGVQTVDFVLVKDGAELARRTVKVPGR